MNISASNPVTKHLRTSEIVPLNAPAHVRKSFLAHGSWQSACGDIGKKKCGSFLSRIMVSRLPDLDGGFLHHTPDKTQLYSIDKQTI